MIGDLSAIAPSSIYSRRTSDAILVNKSEFTPSSTAQNQVSATSFDARFSYGRINSSFLAYENQMKTGGASDYAKVLDENKEAYFAIVQQAKDSGGLNDPQAFVRGLSTSQLEVLQKTHDLVHPIQAV